MVLSDFTHIHLYQPFSYQSNTISSINLHLAGEYLSGSSDQKLYIISGKLNKDCQEGSEALHKTTMEASV